MNSSPMKVLIVDDQDGIRFLLDIVLKEEGHTVFMARNGQEGVDKCLDLVPDLIFMDIRMPVMDGIRAVKEIRRFNKDVYIVIMTAYSEKKAIDELKKCDVYDYISKPFDVADIQKIVKSLALNKQKSPQYHCG